jgi:hypothetical protein
LFYFLIRYGFVWNLPFWILVLIFLEWRRVLLTLNLKYYCGLF